jgi:hypothetical protein
VDTLGAYVDDELKWFDESKTFEEEGVNNDGTI